MARSQDGRKIGKSSYPEHDVLASSTLDPLKGELQKGSKAKIGGRLVALIDQDQHAIEGCIKSGSRVAGRVETGGGRRQGTQNLP